jgi:alpha-tubulin suppressor-like RCC1 family protein
MIVAFACACSGTDATAPVAVPAATSATSLALGARFGCAITTDAGTFCWGDNSSGQIGDSTRTRRPSPAPTRGSHDFVAIAAAEKTACGIDHSGVAWCWGEDATQPGVATVAGAPTRVTTPSPLVSITVGRKFACGLSDGGQAFCWGENNRGQLGVGDTLRRQGVTVVPGTPHFTTISAGFWHVCALDQGGAAYCWGDDQYGELAPPSLGAAAFSATPQKVSGNVVFRSLASGSIHACGLATSGQAYCWGSNSSGQLGEGTANFHLAPTPVGGGLTFTMLRSSRANSIFSHTCGLTTSGDVWCWGWNSKGQIGAAVTTDDCVNQVTGAISTVCSYRPVKISGVSNVSTLDVGVEHTCALTKSGQLYCWGDNASGQLGNGTLEGSAAPVAVLGGLKLP